MGEAIRTGIQVIEARKGQYIEEGTEYYRPWLILMTDGAPTDMQVGDPVFAQVAGELQEAIAGRRLIFLPVGVGEEADMNTLRQLVGPHEPPVQLVGLSFAEFFRWLSNSQRKVSSSRVGDVVALEPIKDWAKIYTD